MRSLVRAMIVVLLVAVGVGGALGRAEDAPGERTVFGAVGAPQEARAELATGGSTTWHQPYVPGGGVWRRRVPVEVTNPGPDALMAEPIALPVGSAPHALPLSGVEIRELRVCAANGPEVLFGVRDVGGVAVTDGRLREGYRVVIPASCDPGASRVYTVYADNPQAWAVPDYLEVRTDLSNGGFEKGAGAMPEGWIFRASDEAHIIAWEREMSHSGVACVSMTAAVGSPASWFTATQTGIQVTAGGHYTLRGWVKGRGIVGKAGLYVHVADGSDPQAVNQVEGIAESTFDWREVVIEFTAPPGALSLALGSVLHGSGQAWYDDVVLEARDVPQATRPRVSVGPEERLELQTFGAASPWPDDGVGLGYRLPLIVRNLSDQAFTGVVWAGLSRLRAQMSAAETVMVRVTTGADDAWHPCVLLADAVAFRVSLPPRSEQVCQAYAVASDQGGSEVAAGGGYRELLDNAWGNLALNPDMEEGQGAPAVWNTGVEVVGQDGPSRFSSDDPEVTYGWISPGFVGNRCVRMTVGKEARTAWRGWRQAVAVTPDTTYLYASWVRTADVSDGEVRLHCHTLDVEGQLCGGKTHSVGTAAHRGLTGSNDWTLLIGTVHTSPDTRSAILYLTSNAKGTMDHDGVIFCAVTEAIAGEGETNPERLTRDLMVWQENPIVKIFRDHRPGPPVQELKAFAARNERESVQMAVLARRDVSMTVAVQSPVHTTGYRLPEVAVARVGYVPVDHVSAFFQGETTGGERVLPQGSPISDGWVGWWPDPLLPLHGPVAMIAGQVQPLWLTFSIPEDAPAGDYRGVVTLASEGGTEEIPIQLTVWDFDLPNAPRLTALFDLREGPGWHFLTPSKRRAWLRFMADHRLCVDQILPAPVMRLEDGQVHLDTAEFDQAAAWCFDDLGMRTAYLPLEFYAFGWGHDIRPFRGLSADSEAYREAYGQCLAALWKHVQAKGWGERFVLYVSDEPAFDDRDPAVAARILAQMKSQCSLIHAAAPGLKIYSSTWRYTSAWDDDLDIWGVGAFGCFPVETMDRLRAGGRTIWLTTDAQLLLDTPYSAIERLNPYYCFAYGAVGYEFWALGWWTYENYDPFRFGWYAYIPHTFTPDGPTQMIRYPNGSGHLAYPGWRAGEGDGPLSSIRLEQVREGMEDFEYMETLRQRITTARQRGVDVTAAERVLERVRELVPIPNAGGTRSTAILPDPDAVLRLRADLAAEIQRLGP